MMKKNKKKQRKEKGKEKKRRRKKTTTKKENNKKRKVRTRRRPDVGLRWISQCLAQYIKATLPLCDRAKVTLLVLIKILMQSPSYMYH